MIASKALVAALEAKAGVQLRCKVRTTTWHSLELVGERHEVSVAHADASTVTALLEGLDDYGFSLASGFVADIFADATTLVDGTSNIHIEALTFSAN